MRLTRLWMKVRDKVILLVYSNIHAFFSTEISPTLEKLRGQRSDYLKWSTNNTELKRYEKFNIAYQYTEARSKLTKSEDEVANMRTSVATLEKETSNKKEEMRGMSDKAALLTKRRNKEMEVS